MRPSPAAIVLAAAALSRAGAQTFDIIAPSPGLRDTFAYTVSDDGTVVHGHSETNSGSDHTTGYFWTRDRGRQDYALQAPAPRFVLTYGGSGDGRVGVGEWFQAGGQPSLAFRYSSETGLESLGVLAQYSSSRGNDASFDGRTVVGSCAAVGRLPQQGFVWTTDQGMQGIGFLRPDHFQSEATAVSASGSVVVGLSAGWNDQSAILWTAANGLVELPALPGTGLSESAALGVNDQGNVVVGYSGRVMQAAVWRAGGVEPLPPLILQSRSLARATDSLGEVIVGRTEGLNVVLATAWTSSGAQYLGDYFRQFGVVTPEGFTYLDCLSVSADGRTFCGYGGNVGQFTGYQAFVVTVPAVPTFVVALAGIVGCARRKR